MSAALTKAQKAYLAQLANQAFNRQRALALGRGEVWPHQVEAWRHDQVAAACGKLGLRCCSQDDYGAVKGHLLALLGQEGRALNADVHGANNARRVVEWKVVELLKAMGVKITYADSICRRMTRGRGLVDASERELWSVFYALTREARARKKAEQKEQQINEGKEPVCK